MKYDPRFGAFALAAVLGFASSARADEEPSAADVSSARSLGQEGVKLADAGNCQEAVDRFQRAEKLFHAPTTLARLGECQVQLGKLVEGTENLNRVSRESLAANAPTAFKDAQERAKKILAEAKPKIAKLKIAVAAPPDAQLMVKVDNENLPLANLNTNRPIDPGDHVVEVSAPGYLKASGKVHLGEGAVDSIALTLEVDPNAPKVVAPSPGTPAQTTSPLANGTTTDPERPSGVQNRLPMYISYGVGGAGVVLGAVFGIVASGKKGDLTDNCPNKVCPAGQQDTIDSAKTAATISTISFVVGALGVGVGTYFLVTGTPKRTAKAGISPYFTGTGAGVTGRF